MTVSTENPSRRAALGAIASVPVLALPVGAMAAPADDASRYFRPGVLDRGLKIFAREAEGRQLDAELFALIDAARDAHTRLETSSEALEAAPLDAYDEALRQEAELVFEHQDLWGRIATTRAHTMAGVRAKLALVTLHYSIAELTDDLEDGEQLERVLASVAVDVKLGGEEMQHV
jgi:hypothetical protein